jgi:hypothetical protein
MTSEPQKQAALFWGSSSDLSLLMQAAQSNIQAFRFWWGVTWCVAASLFTPAPRFATWMNGPFYKLQPEEVEADTNDAFRCVWEFATMSWYLKM